MEGKILRTGEEVHEYLSEGDTIRFVSIELYRWYNPMRLIYGNYYWIVL